MKIYKLNIRRERMRKARASLGNPSELDEAIVATGIDAFMSLLDGDIVEIGGQLFTLEKVSEEGDHQ